MDALKGDLGPGAGTNRYAGSEVMVSVPFDENGGAWSGENRVIGPLHVFRSRFHSD
jgi:hypothetical protein